ncbi:uncharacterized protein (DUF885 family) [Crossiella equi]|uniref:Uncharacterized protein (DUF885 family) n=1 Tax=Crossiella equi TaxID=130796 RepID=A0ABS5ANR3_9PSEU|nr:hypothetical protein [Crossiella equi]MBP2478032.1 uncharacterized protein (DUF885 family) [Crossiella equi]
MTVVGDLAGRLVRVLATEDPLNDLLDGLPEFAGRLPEVSAAGQASLGAEAAEVARLAKTLVFPPGDSGIEPVTRDVVVQQAEAVVTRVESQAVGHTMLDLGSSPVVVVLQRLPASTPSSVEAQEAFLKRVAAVPSFLDDAAERHRGGLASAWWPSRGRAPR